MGPTFTPAEIAAEEWRPVVGSTTHEVSNLGRVRRIRLRNGRPGTAMIGTPNTSGYRHVGVPRTRMVHTMVAEAFIGPRPVGMLVCHNDGDRQNNNRAANLRYDTPKGNAADRWEHGTIGDRLLPYLDVLGTMPDRALARLAGVSFQRVHQVRVKHGVPAFSKRAA